MNNIVIGYMCQGTIVNMSHNLDCSFKGAIDIIITKLKERHSNLVVHIDLDKTRCNFDIKDAAVVYYSPNNNTFHLGKWRETSAVNSVFETNNIKCGTAFQLAEYLTNHINKTNNNSNEDRLQEPDNTGGKSIVERGVAIEVTGVGTTVESGQISYTAISC